MPIHWRLLPAALDAVISMNATPTATALSERTEPAIEKDTAVSSCELAR